MSIPSPIRHLRFQALLAALIALLPLPGCAPGPRLLPTNEQTPIDRRFVEYPSGFQLRPLVRNLTAPTAIAFDEDGVLFVAEGGLNGDEPRIFGFRPADGSRVDIYPTSTRLVPFGLVKPGFHIYGPVGGIAAGDGKVFVSHRDADGLGVITAFGYDGSHTTVVSDLPAQGDYGVTDVLLHEGRLYFGVGTATNSGVVGIDNWAVGWVKDHPKTCDRSYLDLKLHGRRFDTPNPAAGLLGGSDIAVTGPFQPFGTSNQTLIPKDPNGKPNGAIYTVNPLGGGLRVFAHGLHNPRGLAWHEYRLYATNDGMELRGTRPVMNDPDVLLWITPDTWYGWPDFSADLMPISDPRFQPTPLDLIARTGYPDLSFLIDHETSGLVMYRPDASRRIALIQGVFPSLSGAAKLCFVEAAQPAFKEFAGNAIVALCGDRYPFATSGQKLKAPVGYKVCRVDIDTHQVFDFIRNTKGLPAHMLEEKPEALERPIDVKFGPDGALYVLDFGHMEMRGGTEKPTSRSGRIFKLAPILPGRPKPPRPATRPTNDGILHLP